MLDLGSVVVNAVISNALLFKLLPFQLKGLSKVVFTVLINRVNLEERKKKSKERQKITPSVLLPTKSDNDILSRRFLSYIESIMLISKTFSLTMNAYRLKQTILHC